MSLTTRWGCHNGGVQRGKNEIKNNAFTPSLFYTYSHLVTRHVFSCALNAGIKAVYVIVIESHSEKIVLALYEMHDLFVWKILTALIKSFGTEQFDYVHILHEIQSENP